jgi:hypothetical protein
MLATRTIRTVKSRILRRVALALVPLPVGLGFASWFFTAPLDSSRITPALVRDQAATRVPALPRITPAAPRPEWPTSRLEGDPAKRLLLDYLLAARERLDQIPSYSAQFTRQERIRGHLSDPVHITLKLRLEPLSIYMRFLDGPEAAKEVVYQADRNDGHVIGHYGGLSRRILPRVALMPDSPIVMANNRHPITQTGLHNLVHRLIGYRVSDLSDSQAQTILDTFVDDQGRTWHRSIHLHPIRHPDRPFAKAIVLYDPSTGLPRQFQGFDWPESDSDCEPTLGETYTYDDLDPDATFTDLDFDPANPAYEFTRF